MGDIKEIEKEFKDKVDLIVNGGNLTNGVPSTIIKVKNHKIEVLRKGNISKEELERRIDK